jgi:hypothetical protein
MIDKRSALTVLENRNGEWLDLTLKAADYLRDPFNFTMDPDDDTLFIGYYKPFSGCYIELQSPASANVGLVAEYHNGSAWVPLDVQDETDGFRRSGFLSWNRTKLTEQTVNGKDAFFVRLKATATEGEGSPIECVVRGINVVFTSPARLKQEFFEVDDPSLLPAGETSHIGALVATKHQIVQELRNKGYQKRGKDSPSWEMIGPWDLLDVFEVREAATFLALSKLFFNLSSSPDDNWWNKYREYQDKYKNAMNLAFLSIDTNDDGKADKTEVQAPARVVRWRR